MFVCNMFVKVLTCLRQLENVAIANALQLAAARRHASPFRFITTPCQVWSRWTYPLPYNRVFAADTLLYAVTLTFDLWHWTFALYHMFKLYLRPNLRNTFDGHSQLLSAVYW